MAPPPAPEPPALEGAAPPETASHKPEPTQPPAAERPAGPAAEPSPNQLSGDQPSPGQPSMKESSAEAPAGSDETVPSRAGGASQLAAAGVTGAMAQLPAWRRFARPFPADDPRPRIAIIVAELGFSETATRAAIRRLPAAVTFSFTPYSRRLQQWIGMARADGHEVMLDLPMEPVSYPHDDPGPKALFTTLSDAENEARLEWTLDRASGYVGVVPWMGSRFTTSAEDMRPILEQIDTQGLMFVDARPAPDSVATRLADEIGLPRAINTRFLDHVPSREAIESRLRQIEREARTTGFAVGMASPYPITIEILDRWIRTLDHKGLALAPISALANRQTDP